uniref:TNF family profile domain-containing protein n=1 Tax=Anolis carolinensis TaxID=28377 RepID=A0A803TXM3_ANOCA
MYQLPNKFNLKTTQQNLSCWRLSVITMHTFLCFAFALLPPGLSMEAPVSSQDGINWMWKQDCAGSVRNTSSSSLEILESGIYFVYVYVARLEDISTQDFFTVQLVDHSENILSLLRGFNDTRAFVNMGRSFFLAKGIKLHLEMNAGLEYIDTSWTYWGLFKIQ